VGRRLFFFAPRAVSPPVRVEAKTSDVVVEHDPNNAYGAG